MEVIQLKNVSKIYKTGETEMRALNNISLSLECGKFIVILGQSGAGKSTLLNLLGGLDKLTEGQIIVNGKDLSSLTNDELAEYRAENVGFVLPLLVSTFVSILIAKKNKKINMVEALKGTE